MADALAAAPCVRNVGCLRVSVQPVAAALAAQARAHADAFAQAARLLAATVHEHVGSAGPPSPDAGEGAVAGSSGGASVPLLAVAEVSVGAAAVTGAVQDMT